MALINKLSAIGDAIREKTGKEELIKLDDMPAEIASITSGGGDATMEDGLIEGTITEYTNNRIKTVGYCKFRYNNHLKRVTMLNCEKVEMDGFNGCTALESIEMPNVTNISTRGFSGCNALKEVNLPNLTNITQAFNNCAALTKITLPKLKIISNAFNHCAALQIAVFSEATQITASAFSNDTSLTAVILRNSQMVTLGNVNAFTNTPIANGTGYIYVPKALIEEYKVATNWVTFANQFRAIEDYPEICGGAE